MRRSIAALASAALVTALVNGSAPAAASSSTSDVVFSGSGKYALRYVLHSGETFTASASFRFRTVFLRAFFVRGDSGRSLSSIRNNSYGGRWKVSVIEPGHMVLCSGRGSFGNPPLHSTAPAQLRYAWSAATGVFSSRVFGLPRNELPTVGHRVNDCTSELPDTGNAGFGSGDFWGDWVLGFSETGGPKQDVLSAKFRFPGAALFNPHATETISATASKMPGSCRHASYRTCTQSYRWIGTAVFTHRH